MDSLESKAGLPASLFLPTAAAKQPPHFPATHTTLTAVISTLAMGGAEKIVLEWAASVVQHTATRFNVRLVVLRSAECEWPLPPGVLITRLALENPLQQLEALARTLVKAGNPTVLCHLLRADERAALTRGGARAIPVLHNAEQGWSEGADTLARAPQVITVSRAAEMELKKAGVRTPCSVIRHLPRTPGAPANGHAWRERWAIPRDALVIGMLGAVKPQKDYPRALHLFAALLAQRDAWLVILGGPVGRDGPAAWYAVLATAQRLGIAHRVRLPGFVGDAVNALPAFDLLLNTSQYEGLSIATLEALAAGLPAVVSAVGGQGEVQAPGLTLVDSSASEATWLTAITQAAGTKPDAPAWRGFPAHRLWTLFHLPPPSTHAHGTLFVTANLNAGGAQRSLVNLACALHGAMRFEIAVCGNSSTDYFYDTLTARGITVHRSAATRDCFDHAEELCNYLILNMFSTICFWNTDAKVKLLLSKALQHTCVRIIDVSPGGYAFEEMSAVADFQQWIAFDEAAYYVRLDALVLKFKGDAPAGVRKRMQVIPNGVPSPQRLRLKSAAENKTTRIVVSGRIAPSKFLLEILAAMRLLWQQHPRVELHVLGTVEARHAEYGQALMGAIGSELNHRVYLHGECFDAPERVADYDIALVLGEHQGCPNAVLEALAAGVPVVANDSGGTREQVLHQRTGLLIHSTAPTDVAQALAQLIDDPVLARKLAQAGRKRVEKRFSMQRMLRAYRKLLNV